MKETLEMEVIRKNYPDEWVLIGDPIMDDKNIDVLAGVPIYHSKDKKEVCYKGRDKTANYGKISLVFTGDLRPTRKITGIFRRVKP